MHDLRQSFLLYISEEFTNERSRKIHAEDLKKHDNFSKVLKLEFGGIIFEHQVWKCHLVVCSSMSGNELDGLW